MTQPESPTERLYVSGSSWGPVLVAVGLVGVLIGLFGWWPVAAAAAFVFFFGVVGWLRGNREDIARMPVDQHTDTAPIPLSGRE